MRDPTGEVGRTVGRRQPSPSRFREEGLVAPFPDEKAERERSTLGESGDGGRRVEVASPTLLEYGGEEARMGSPQQGRWQKVGERRKANQVDI